MNQEIIRVVLAFFGSLGFAIFFNVKKGHIIYAAMNGLLSLIINLLAFSYLGNEFISSMVSSVFAATYGEVLARIRKAPASQFMIIGLIPLVPGASLYYTMIYSVTQSWNEVKHFARLTVECALGIAVGISLVWAFVNIVWALANINQVSKQRDKKRL